MLAILALTLTLALAACGTRGAHNNTGGANGANQQTSGQTTSGNTGSSSSASSSDTSTLQNADQQIQNAVSSMDNAQSTAAGDSSSDNETQP
jgi:hypothetical protein